MRNKSGNMLALIAAFIFIVVALLVFGLSYLRLIGTQSEQKSAIQAAALAAARDLSKIVIDTPEFGFVGLSDAAPIGTITTATDQYHTQVAGINTIIGTARVDAILASKMGIPEWQILAKQDLDAAKAAGAALETALNAAIAPSGSGQDINGNNVEPYKSAEQAYKENQIRMTGSSNYVANSLNLQLGAITGGTQTNVDTPNPAGIDGTLNNSNTVGGKYKSYTNIPFGGEDFVFAGVGENIKLVDTKRWVASVSGLPYQIATVVRAEALQQITDGGGTNRQIKAIACAQPASVNDPRPAPGALLISFPDGMPDDKEVLATPLDLYNAPHMQDKDDDSDLYNSSTGDYPVAISSTIEYEPSWPLQSVDPNRKANNCCKLAVYDWIRRGGIKVDINSVLGMHSTPFDPQGPDVMWPPPPPVGVNADPEPIPAGIAHIYRIEPSGKISYESKPVSPIPFSAVSDSQFLIECHDCIDKGAKKLKVKKIELGPPLNVSDGEAEFTGTYDLYVRIYGRRYGSSSGGNHRGQPLDDSFVSFLPESQVLSCSGTGGTIRFSDLSFYGLGAKKKGAKGTAGTVGKGALPILGPREDFGFTLTGPASWSVDRSMTNYRAHQVNSGAPTKRPTYQTNGIAAEIRFRRVIKAKKSLFDAIGEYGYVMVK